MIISHRHKFAFFRVPKTGSSTTEIILRLCGAIDKRDISTGLKSIGLPSYNIPETVTQKLAGSGFIEHMTPSSAVAYGLITVQQLQEYHCVATIRKPANRWRSALGHVGLVTPEDSIRMLESKTSLPLEILEIPQAEYFIHKEKLVCEPLWFDCLEDEIKQLMQSLGIKPLDDIPKLNVSPIKKADIPLSEFVPNHLRPVFQARFESDIKLYKHLLKKYRSE